MGHLGALYHKKHPQRKRCEPNNLFSYGVLANEPLLCKRNVKSRANDMIGRDYGTKQSLFLSE